MIRMSLKHIQNQPDSVQKIHHPGFVNIIWTQIFHHMPEQNYFAKMNTSSGCGIIRKVSSKKRKTRRRKNEKRRRSGKKCLLILRRKRIKNKSQTDMTHNKSLIATIIFNHIYIYLYL